MEYRISTDKAALNVEFVHDYMVNTSYWGKGRTLEQTARTIENSYCFGMYTQSNEQIGFARVVTDFVFFGNIMDVFITPEYQGQGLGKALIAHMLEDKLLNELQTFTLKTKDAHALYERYGFKKIGDSALYMARDMQKLDGI